MQKLPPTANPEIICPGIFELSSIKRFDVSMFLKLPNIIVIKQNTPNPAVITDALETAFIPGEEA